MKSRLIRFAEFVAVACVALCGFVVLAPLGCAPLKPGADPLVVRVEQSETTARDTFTLVLQADNQNRSYWRTNAPAFHQYCEWLREPLQIGTNVLPRDLAMILTLNDVKNLYKTGRSTSNDLASVQADMTTALTDALAWLKMTRSQPVPPPPPSAPSVQILHP
jgi:hypothetical protein